MNFILVSIKLELQWITKEGSTSVKYIISSPTQDKVVPYTSGKIWSARLIFLFFSGSVFEYIQCNKYQNFNKFQPTDSEL